MIPLVYITLIIHNFICVVGTIYLICERGYSPWLWVLTCVTMIHAHIITTMMENHQFRFHVFVEDKRKDKLIGKD